MLKLPNDLWLRGNKLPNYAICLDPANRFFGWQMVEHPDGQWMSVKALTMDETATLKGLAAAAAHIAQILELQVKLAKERA